MTNDILIVNGIAGLLIIFVLVWFFGIRPSAALAETDMPITVLVKDGIYEPSYIQIPVGKSVKLHFIRHDATPCSEGVIFPQLNLAYQLPIGKMVEVVLPAQEQAGEIDFTCQMGMYRGKIVVA